MLNTAEESHVRLRTALTYLCCSTMNPSLWGWRGEDGDAGFMPSEDFPTIGEPLMQSSGYFTLTVQSSRNGGWGLGSLSQSWNKIYSFQCQWIHHFFLPLFLFLLPTNSSKLSRINISKMHFCLSFVYKLCVSKYRGRGVCEGMCVYTHYSWSTYICHMVFLSQEYIFFCCLYKWHKNSLYHNWEKWLYGDNEGCCTCIYLIYTKPVCYLVAYIGRDSYCDSSWRETGIVCGKKYVKKRWGEKRRNANGSCR